MSTNAKYKKGISGSTICIAAMYIGWIAYVIGQVVCYYTLKTFLPVEITWGTVGLFLVETVSLARLKMAKEGLPIKNKIANPVLKKLGVELPDFEEEVQEVVNENSSNVSDSEIEEPNQLKECSNGQI